MWITTTTKTHATFSVLRFSLFIQRIQWRFSLFIQRIQWRWPLFISYVLSFIQDNRQSYYRARNSADPLARDKWIWRRTTNIASFCCPPDNLGLAESRQPADSVTRQSRRTQYPRHQPRSAWTIMAFADVILYPCHVDLLFHRCPV